MDPLKASMGVSGSALALQSLRMRVISENIANAEVAPVKPGDEPYQRKYVSFASMVDRSENITSVRLPVDSATQALRSPRVFCLVTATAMAWPSSWSAC